MTPTESPPPPGDDEQLTLGDLALGTNDLNGHSIDELAEYYDAGLRPADATIDKSVGCQIALAAIGRLRALTMQLTVDDAATEEPLDESFIAGILSQISVQARAGRDIPLHLTETGPVVITEGALRGIVRAAGDSIHGLFIGRCTLTGDISTPGEPITVNVDASVLWGHDILETADQVKGKIIHDLARHSSLIIEAVNVTVHDVRAAPTESKETL